MTEYVIELETSRTSIDEDLIDTTMDALTAAQPSIGSTIDGYIQVTDALDAETPVAAAEHAVDMLITLPDGQGDAFTVTGLHVLPSEVFDAR